MGILSDCFLLKTLIHLWNFSGTSFFISASDFAVFSFSFQISQSSTTLFTFIVFSFFYFFFYCFTFSSCFFPASSFTSSSFCFYYSGFPYFSLHCFSHSSGHLVILTSPIFQLISGLWQASHGMPKIICYFCPSIISISVLSLYS